MGARGQAIESSDVLDGVEHCIDKVMWDVMSSTYVESERRQHPPNPPGIYFPCWGHSI